MIATAITALLALYNPSYEEKAWHQMLLIWSMLLIALIFNLVLRRLLNSLETIGGICHVLFFVAIVIVLAVMGERSPSSFVFTKMINNVSGWTNKGVAFHLGLSAAFLPLSGYDSVLHMSKASLSFKPTFHLLIGFQSTRRRSREGAFPTRWYSQPCSTSLSPSCISSS